MKNKPYPLYKVDYVDNFKDFLELCCKKYKNKIAFEFERDKKIISKTFYDFTMEVKALASYFIDNKIINKKIAVLGENSYEWILSYFAIVNSGNIVIPIDKDLSIEQVENILKDTEAQVVMISNEYRDYEEIIKQELNINIINIKSNLESVISKGRIKYRADKRIYQNIEINSEKISTIIYTSGTTGNPKGVVLTHGNICKNVISGMESFKMEGNTILILPLHHTYTFSGAVLCVMYSGCKNYINKSLKKLPEDMKTQKPVFLLAVPLIIESFYKKIWNVAKDRNKDKLLKIIILISNFLLIFGIDIRKKIFKNILEEFGGKLNMAICGGAAIDKKYLKGFKNLGIDVLIGYGITECSPFVSVNRNKYYRYGSVGTPLTCSTVKIDKKDNETEGEILVKGEMVMKGYYKNPQLTEMVMKNEYFMTGDIGYQDKDGYIYITGRKKNIIILSNGKNVYPEEIEFELLNSEYINEVLVYEENGKIVSEIFPNEELLEQEMITNRDDFFNKIVVKYNRKVPIYKNINVVKLRDSEFEKTTSKKIKRKYKESI